MNQRKLKKREKATAPLYEPPPDKVPDAFGACQDFWFFREGERAYHDYWNLLGRRDAPVQISMDVVGFAAQTLHWVPSVNPSSRAHSPGFGLNLFGPTIINQSGGTAFAQICRGWAQIFAQGPDPLILTHGNYGIAEEGRYKPPRPYRFKLPRDPLVRDLETLADWGEKAATGEFFILHLGI